MTAIIAFPLARRSSYIKRHAARMACLRAGAAEAYLRRQLDIQRDALIRKGIDPASIETDLKELERAILLAAARRSSPADLPGGAA